MTKRWLSLVLVLTLLSTLFTGVAFAETTYNLKVQVIEDRVLTPGVENQITLGTIDCAEAGGAYADSLADQVAAHLTQNLKIAFAEGSEAWDDGNSVSATAEGSVVTVTATYKPAPLPADTYRIMQMGGRDTYVFTTSGSNTCRIQLGSSTTGNFGTYTIEDEYQVVTDYGMINVGGTAQAQLKHGDTLITEGVSWESNDPQVATVDAATGKITGVSLGDATITAKTKSGVTKQIDIWVISLSKESMYLLQSSLE